MNVLFVAADSLQEWNCSEHRCAIPYRAMSRAGHHCELIHITEFDECSFIAPVITKADLIILQRNLFGPVINKVTFLVAQGKVILADLDDAYKLMEKNTGSPSYEFWVNSISSNNKGSFKIDPPVLENLEWGLKLCSNISSPSKLILEDWEPYGIKTYHVLNYIQKNIYRRHDVYKQPGKIYVGGGGSMSHMMSWSDSGISEALQTIAKEYKNVIVAIAGDERVCKKLDISASRKVSLGWQPFALYSKTLSLFDIGLLPLAGEYDRRRSAIKAIEYTTMGIPWLASKGEPYEEISAGRLVNNTAEDWYNNIKDCIDNLPDKKAEAEKQVEWAIENYDIDINIKTLCAIYEKVMEDNKC